MQGDCELTHSQKHRLENRQNSCQVLGERKEWIGNKTKMLDRAQVEGTGGSDKGREVNSGKHGIEREMGRRTEEG